jgi:uncharacterized alkaline shock family protein YloU
MKSMLPIMKETIRALHEIILIIIQTNINENPNLRVQDQLVGNIISALPRRKLFLSKGIHIELINDEIMIEINIDIFKSESMLADLAHLQEKIHQDIFQITGFQCKCININVKNIIN